MMKPLVILFATAHFTMACGPYFPPSYLSDLDSHFIENINIPRELELLADEYGLTEHRRFWSGSGRTAAEADQYEFDKAAHTANRADLGQAFDLYAAAVRSGDTNTPPLNVPEHLREFTLYLEGVAQMHADPAIQEPKAWMELLELPKTNRLHRTTWVHYMLGNLAAKKGDLVTAATHWGACRDAEDEGFEDQLGLANATLKTEYLAQTNLSQRIHCGVNAIAYYSRQYGTGDKAKLKHCLEFLYIDAGNIHSVDDPLQVEVAALLRFGNAEFIEKLSAAPQLKITPRLAWFMYKNGEIAKATEYLKYCPADDTLSIWLRFRVAQRNGHSQVAIHHLKDWMKRLKDDNRIFYEFEYDGGVSRHDAAYGNLGQLFASQNQMMDALQCFIEAGAYPDAALIAERYVETDRLRQYVETFDARPQDEPSNGFYDKAYKLENTRDFTERHMAYLLGRRLFREGRPADALPYYPPQVATLLKTYLEALEQSERFWNTPNTRAAHRYHAARILRWKGMEICGTEFSPDFHIVNGLFDWSRVSEQIGTPIGIPPLYEATEAEPYLRFHYRYKAAELADEAARLSWNRHQKAMILWSAGEWLKTRHPEAADPYYKQLATIPFQSLAKAADEKRWFPEPTYMMSHIHDSIDYHPPEELIRAAREYRKN